MVGFGIKYYNTLVVLAHFFFNSEIQKKFIMLNNSKFMVKLKPWPFLV
jgi:hypothetical protein